VEDQTLNPTHQNRRMTPTLNPKPQTLNPKQEDDADDMEDEEVKRWLRADFTPLKSEVKVKNKMKAVGLGLLAGT
jgi:hypothetical protein